MNLSLLERPTEDEATEALEAAKALGTGGKAFVIFCARATHTFLTNNSMQMAAAIAFYSFFSLFPLSLLIILSFDTFVSQTVVQEAELARAISTFIPVSPETVANSISTAADSKDVTGPLALIGLVWASTAVFATLRKGINTAWNVRTPRAFLQERVIDLAFTAGAGLVLIVLLIATTAIRIITEDDDGTVATGIFSAPIWLTIGSLFMTFLVFTLAYRFLPNRRVQFKNVLFGALMAAIAFEIAKSVFFAYTQTRGDVTQIYGEFTSVAVLLGWLYVSAAIMLVGGLTASIYTQLIGLRIVGHADVWSFGAWPGIKKLVHRMRRNRSPSAHS